MAQVKGYPLFIIEFPGDTPKPLTPPLPNVIRLGESGRGRSMVEIPVEGEGRFFAYEGGDSPRLIASDSADESGLALVEINAVGGYSRSRTYDIRVWEGNLRILEKGIHAFGTAGRINNGPHVLAIVEPGTVFRLNDKNETYVYLYAPQEKEPWVVMSLEEYRFRKATKEVSNQKPIGRVYRCLTLRGDIVTPGIVVEKGFIPFDPHWGFSRAEQFLGSVILRNPEEVKKVYYVRVLQSKDKLPVLRMARRPDGERPWELVLVQEYATGVGAKRWPGFSVELEADPFVSVLSRAYTTKGSGAETWSLVIAPPGWARNIARQFVNKRGYPSQHIAYRPRLRWNGVRLELGTEGHLLVHLEGEPSGVEAGIKKMMSEGWWDRLSKMFIHIFGDPSTTAVFVWNVPLSAFTVNGTLVVPPKVEEVEADEVSGRGSK